MVRAVESFFGRGEDLDLERVCVCSVCKQNEWIGLES